MSIVMALDGQLCNIIDELETLLGGRQWVSIKYSYVYNRVWSAEQCSTVPLPSPLAVYMYIIS